MLYKPNQLSPKNSAIDPSISNTFTWQCNGAAQTDYRAYIYNNSTSALLYDTTKITSSTQSFVLPSSTITAGTECKWFVRCYNGADDEDSNYEFFVASSTPVVTFLDPVFGGSPTPLSTQDYTFICNYAQAESISIKKFKFDLYDASGTTIIDTSDWVYDFTVEYTFTGMQNGVSYQIECLCVSQNDIEGTSGKKSFYITYPTAITSQELTITPNDEFGYMDLDWSALTQVVGVSDVDDYSYISGKFNYGIQVNTDLLIYTHIFNESDFTLTGWFKLPYNYDNIFITIQDTIIQNIGYDLTSHRFYVASNLYSIVYSNVVTLYTWNDLIAYSDDWLTYSANEWLEIFDASSSYTQDWWFFAITLNYVIFKVNNQVQAVITLPT